MLGYDSPPRVYSILKLRYSFSLFTQTIPSKSSVCLSTADTMSAAERRTMDGETFGILGASSKACGGCRGRSQSNAPCRAPRRRKKYIKPTPSNPKTKSPPAARRAGDKTNIKPTPSPPKTNSPPAAHRAGEKKYINPTPSPQKQTLSLPRAAQAKKRITNSLSLPLNCSYSSSRGHLCPKPYRSCNKSLWSSLIG